MKSFYFLIFSLIGLAPTLALANGVNNDWHDQCESWMNSMMGYGWPMMGGWWGSGMIIFNLIFGILIIVGLVYLVKYLARGNQQTPDKDSALKILKERYAKGEIDKKEFEEKMKDIQ